MTSETAIHPSSVIEPGAGIGAGVRIGPFCHVGPDAVLGDGVELVSHVTVMGATTIGAGTKVYPMAILGGPPQNSRHKGGRTTLTIGANCTIREAVTMHLGTDTSRGETVIGDNGNFLAYVHIAHDCIVGRNATFANGGKRAKPYGILDITTSKGDLLYSRERDEPPAEQVVSRQVAEGMNTMLYRVVNEGTGGMANLDFTNVAGKTGTSTGPKDAWFMGFTGKYVAGVWIGNDDNHAMRMGVTGGHQAAPVWHDLMTVAHADMNIPTIPGLQPHPRQIEEQQRLAAIKAAQVAAGLEPATKDETGKPETIMSEKTRAVLKSLTTALRKAEGGPGDPATPPPSNAPQDPKDPKTPERADRRATLFDSYSGEPGASGAQRAQ